MDNRIAYCGLACCLCGQNEKCPGCQAGSCEIHGWCKNYKCCHKKSLNGCWECSEFPCKSSMYDKLRVRAFARFAKEYGVDELARCLMRNKGNGVVYHYDGQLVGDYDKGRTEEEIIEMIKNGTSVNACFCGQDCSRCLTYKATVGDSDELREKSRRFYLDEFGFNIPLSKIHCRGGRSDDIFYLCKGCPWMKCCRERGIDACLNCSEYPCPPLAEYIGKYVNKCNQTED